ncbi:MAG: SPASM domain-containing protein [Bacteroidales bacterium]|nr:SPASM domain-containing protein [Bacteroidales bacterium]
MRKIVNLGLLFLSYLVSILLKKPIIWGYPSFVSIEPTNHCNLRCPECPTGQSGLTRDSGSLKQQDFTRFIDQLIPQLAYLTLYFQGEPYLNKELFRFISYARSRSVYTWTSTNGHFLTENNIKETIQSGLNKLIISLDGTDQKAYEQYRIGGSYDTVVNGIRNFVRIRKEMDSRKPLLEIQFLVLKSNQHQIKEIRKLGNSLGADRTLLKTAQFYDFEQGNPLMPEEGKWSRYKPRKEGRRKKDEGRGTRDEGRRMRDEGRRMRDEGRGKREEEMKKHQSRVTSHQSQVTDHGSRIPDARFRIKNPLPNRCFRMWSGCVITWNGKVVPCCFDKDAEHCLGDLSTQSFKEIWKGDKYQRFRQAILNNRKSIDICRNCSQRW